MTTPLPESERQARSEPDRVRRERHLLLAIETFFEARSPAFVVLTSLALIALIGAIDVGTGPVLTPGLFYLVPVALVTWHRGKWTGVVIASIASGMWLTADLVGHAAPPSSIVPYENALLRFVILVVVAGLVSTLKDTLQKQRELAASERRGAQDLRALNELKDTLLHALSHDLRGPITAILGSVQTLGRTDRAELSPEQRAALVHAMGVSARKLNRMVNDLLDLDRLDQGVVEPEREPVDIGAMTRALIAEADFLERHPVEVDVDDIVVSVDAGKVERILENLLVNAAKHTPDGTPVLVRATAERDGVLLSVQDEGPGIPDEVKTAIFEPFHQGEEAHASGSGAGIGLSLVRKFTELHGGRAWVEDRPGGGTKFFVFLPGEMESAPRLVGDVRTAASVSTSL